jgi:hypothetical protein
MASAFTNADTQVRPMPCCMWQRDNAFDMAGDVAVDTGRVAGGGVAAKSATEPRANAADMMNIRIGRHSRTSRMNG